MPYGYKKTDDNKIDIDTEEAEVIKLMFNLAEN
jgi:hypothetical protein